MNFWPCPCLLVSTPKKPSCPTGNEFERHYRNYLAEKYGTKLQAISGIHYNMELGKDLVEALFQESGPDWYNCFQNALYLKLAQNYELPLGDYLSFGAAPIAEQGFFDQEVPEPCVPSVNSDHGYVNKEEIQVSFASLEDYVSAIENYIEQGDLIAEKEFYSAVRFRGQKVNRSFLDKGITYLEFRNFDLNPFERIGISQTTMDTVHLLLLAFLWLDALKNVDQALAQGHALNEKLPSLILFRTSTFWSWNSEHYDSYRPTGATFWAWWLSSGLVKQVKDAFADSSQTLAAQLLLISKTSPFLTLPLTRRLPIMITTGLPTMPLRVMRRWNFLPRCCSLMPFKKGFILKS